MTWPDAAPECTAGVGGEHAAAAAVAFAALVEVVEIGIPAFLVFFLRDDFSMIYL